MQRGLPALSQPVAHSLGLARPRRALPPLACDSHMHIFDTRFKPSAHWTRGAPDAPVAAYRQVQHRLGTERAVVVTPSTYGTDNSCMLDALEQMGASARGIAVVHDSVPQDELAALAKRGVCGLRLNFVTPQSWGETTPAMLSRLADKAAPLGWHIQLLVHPGRLIELAPILERLPAPVVIDHMGRIGSNDAPGSEAFTTLLRLLERGRTWVKLSGAYMCSAVGGPSYADTVPMARALVHAASDRLVWGSDWPHTTEAAATVDDAALVNLLDTWCSGDAATLARILVTNPQGLYGFHAAMTSTT